MLHIPNSAGENSLTETENDTLCLKSDKICELQKYNSEKQSRRGPLCFCFFSKPSIYVFSRNARNQSAGKTLADRCASCENIVWISFKRLYEK